MSPITTTTPQASSTPESFRGFEHPEANSVFCPNEFFDIAIPLLNGPALKVLGYFIRKTLGWKDDNGDPLYDEVIVTSSELSVRAGIGERHVTPSLATLIKYNFIACVRPPKKASRGQAAQVGIYRLRIAEEGTQYTRTIDDFTGFHPGVGNCTFTPNSYFDYVLPTQDHAKSKVVGIVLRHTIGYANPNCPGGRRKRASLSRAQIREYANIGSNSTVQLVIDYCITHNFIERLLVGRWHSDPKLRSAAQYGPCFLKSSKQVKATINESTSQIGPEEALPKSGQADHFPNQSKDTSQIGPAKHFPNRAERNISPKYNNKRNVVVKNLEGYELLLKEGITTSTAHKLSESATLDEITNQITWLPFRNPTNRPAMLVLAIKEGWAKPDNVDTEGQNGSLAERYQRQQQQQAVTKAESAARRSKYTQRRQELLAGWNPLSVQKREQLRRDAVAQAPSTEQRDIFKVCDLENPPMAMLELLTEHLSVGVGE